MARLMREMLILGLAAAAAIYLLNPTAGVFELIPDVVPIIGNLDKAGAVLILVNTLAYYGIDLTRLYGRTERKDSRELPTPKS
jgi:uncharacterized membrane protein YkvA (DUF1232 family)